MSIRAMILRSGELVVEEVQINDELCELQSLVEGYINFPILSQTLSINGIDTCINEEGKLDELPMSCAIVDSEGNLLDAIRGNILFLHHDEEGELVDLTNEQVELIHESLKEVTFVDLEELPTLVYNEED